MTKLDQKELDRTWSELTKAADQYANYEKENIDLELAVGELHAAALNYAKANITVELLPEPEFINVTDEEICLEWFLKNSADEKITFYWGPKPESSYALLTDNQGIMIEEIEGDAAVLKVKKWFKSRK